MADTGETFSVSVAASDADHRAAQALRYDVFVRELGGDGPLVDHAAGLECDEFDGYVDHLLLRENATQDVVGVYRLMRADQAAAAGRFYSESEYSLAPLRHSNRNLLELGRSCIRADHRGGAAMFELWNGLAAYVVRHNIEILFGVASFHGTDIKAHAEALSLLHHAHLAPESLRVHALGPTAHRMDLIAPGDIDRVAAMRATPALIKAYLRLGGTVGEGAFIDRAFNTTDICLVLDTERMNARQRRMYAGAAQE